MKKQLALPVLLAVLLFGFAFPNSALAVAGEPIAGVDVNLGSNGGGLMVSSDLGVDSVGTLPTSPLYFLKEWKRGITRFFTFDSVAKAQLELNITNQIAAEVLEVAKTSSTVNYTGLERALQNYTDAQERLRFRITTINGTSNIVDSERFLKQVDEKTALHAALLQQLDANTDSSTPGIRAEGVVELVGDVMKKANESTLKTFTATVSQGSGGGTPTGSVNFLKQKAEEQIKLAGVAIGDVPAGTIVLVVRGMVLPPPTDDESNIFDRWGNLIAKAKGNLESAKKAFAEGKYGEAYGLARSAEAVASAVRVAVGDINGDGRADQTAPASPTSTTKENVKTDENESPRPTDKAKVVPTATTTPEKEKSETSQPSGGSAGPASNSGRDN